MSTASDIYRVASQSDEEREEERVRQLVQLAVDSSVARTKIEETFTHLTKELSQIVSIQRSELFFPRVKELHQVLYSMPRNIMRMVTHHFYILSTVVPSDCARKQGPSP